jgi:K+-transporting ATPase ATPase C chain
MIEDHTEGRQFGVLGELRVNVLEVNLALDATFAKEKSPDHP